MEFVSDFVHAANGLVWATPSSLPWLVVFLLSTGLFVTVRLGFLQVRYLGHAVAVMLGHFDRNDDKGDISHFQALTTALSATVGIGNIAGVALAIHYGGPGAVFWMWLTAVFGMALKFTECTLATHYRDFDQDGHVVGGPMYYMERGLGAHWKPLAVAFAVCAVVSSLGSGNLSQANTIAVSATTDLGLSPSVIGILAATLVAAVILGGIKRIAAVSSRLMPIMAGVYAVAALAILIMNFDKVPGAFLTIFSEAFTPRASIGGSVAGGFAVTLLWGVKRGLFSNEAGQGSAPIAHAAAKTDEPVSEGAVALLEPLIDTLVICTMTAMVIVVTGVWDEKTHTEVSLSQASVTRTIERNGDEPEGVFINRSLAASSQEIERAGAEGLSVFFGEVRSGKALEASFVVSNGFVENAKLFDGKTPFDGRVGWNPATASLMGKRDANWIPLTLRGDALQNSSALTAFAFQRGLAPLTPWGNFIVTISVFLFGLSTMISWSYYGDRCVMYLFNSDRAVFVYRLVFVAFAFVGCTLSLEIVWAFGDLALGLMTIPNLVAIILLLPKVRALTADYFGRIRSSASTPSN